MAAPMVLVIEDDHTIATVIEEALTLEGFDTVCCADAEVAFALIMARRPAVVVLDLWLAGRVLSLDLIARVRAEPAIAPTPLLVYSADKRALATHAALLQQQGCATLAKPFDLGEFLSVVTVLARRANALTALDGAADGADGHHSGAADQAIILKSPDMRPPRVRRDPARER